MKKEAEKTELEYAEERFEKYIDAVSVTLRKIAEHEHGRCSHRNEADCYLWAQELAKSAMTYEPNPSHTTVSNKENKKQYLLAGRCQVCAEREEAKFPNGKPWYSIPVIVDDQLCPVCESLESKNAANVARERVWLVRNLLESKTIVQLADEIKKMQEELEENGIRL